MADAPPASGGGGGDGEGSAGGAPPPVATFFAKRAPKGLMRKRPAADADAGAGAGAGSGAGGDVDEGGVVRRDKIGRKGLDFSTKDDRANVDAFTSFASDRSVQRLGDSGATAALESETAHDRDGRALREKVLAQATDGTGPPADDGIYRGMTSMIDYRAGFRREHNVGAEKARGNHGPLRAPTNVRFHFRMDYQPDVCKDYKETGYCGFGDSCKFMHDRGDYKSGWQLDKEWDEKEKLRKERERAGDDDDGDGAAAADEDEDDGLPFACFICRERFEDLADPVVTRCKHYFCEHCALKQHATSKACFACGQPTQGTFNTAHEIIKRTKEMKRRAAAAAAGGPGAEEEGGGGAAARRGPKDGGGGAGPGGARVGGAGWIIP